MVVAFVGVGIGREREAEPDPTDGPSGGSARRARVTFYHRPSGRSIESFAIGPSN